MAGRLHHRQYRYIEQLRRLGRVQLCSYSAADSDAAAKAALLPSNLLRPCSTASATATALTALQEAVLQLEQPGAGRPAGLSQLQPAAASSQQG